jgi:hypothetical protein
MIPGAFESEITEIPPMDEVFEGTGVCDRTSESAERPTECPESKKQADVTVKSR